MERTLAQKTLTERINQQYDKHLFGGETSPFHKLNTIGFMNRGYWKGIANSGELAQINLIETLVEFFPNKAGNVLDVACGKGASSKFLTKYFDPKDITGINVAQRQLEICKSIAPECNFKLMDATKLDFADAHFDNVLCIEAALHFLTRNKFLEEAYRVLKPSGRLAMLDALCNYDLLEGDEAQMLPKDNYLPNLDAYQENLLKVGFKYVRVEDCTELTMNSSTDYLIRMAENDFDRTQDSKFLEGIKTLKRRAKAFSPVCMVYAIK